MNKKYMICRDGDGNYVAYYKPKYWPWYIECYLWGGNKSVKDYGAERVIDNHSAGLPCGFAKYYEPIKYCD